MKLFSFTFFLPIIAVSLNLIILILLNMFENKVIKINMIVSFLSGLFLIFLFFIFGMKREIFFLHLFSYFSMSFVSWNLYMLSATAQRIRILLEIYHQKDVSLPNILEKYDTEELYRNRIKRLLDLQIISIDKNSIVTIKDRKFIIINFILNLFRMIIYNEKY